MNQPIPSSAPNGAIALEAAAWFARRDRGLTEPEQHAYRAWLGGDSRHASAFAQEVQTWDRLVATLGPLLVADGQPDPDRLAPPSRIHRLIWIPLMAAAAIAAALLTLGRAPEYPVTSPRQFIVHPAPAQLTLEDGSKVELRGTAKVDVQFTAGERRIRLIQGEAFFTATKNAQRPFIVTADRVAVRAIGTAFSVSYDHQDVAVLVTAGRVGLSEVRVTGSEFSPASAEVTALGAGQRGVVHFSADSAGASAPQVTVSDLTPEQIEQALVWQGLRLEYVDRPLGALVADFNRFNRTTLVVENAETGAIRVGGIFRMDNVEDFTRLLRVGFGVTASPRGGEIVLRKPRAP